MSPLAGTTRGDAASTEQVALRFYDVTSADGTRLEAWTNDAEGPTVLLCNGLGTNPYAWPALLRRDCGVRVISVEPPRRRGSDRPGTGPRVGVDAFVEDALAVLDDAGVDRCAVPAGRSASTPPSSSPSLHPERVTGLFAVAGVPGGTFASMGAPLMIPAGARPIASRWRRPVCARSARRSPRCRSRLPMGR